MMIHGMGVNFYFQSYKRLPVTENMLSNRQYHLRMFMDTFTTSFNSSCKDIKTIQVFPFPLLRSVLPSFNLANQIVNGVCFFQTAFDFFPTTVISVTIGFSVYNVNQNKKTITSHLDPDTFP